MPKYRSLTGHNYVSNKTGEEVRVEIGDQIADMNDVAVQNELEAGNIEEWVEEEKGGEK